MQEKQENMREEILDIDPGKDILAVIPKALAT